jgi:hypothetical protein
MALPFHSIFVFASNGLSVFIAWDNTEQVSYHSKSFEELSYDEKRAAIYLGRSPLDFKLKNVKWSTIDDKMKRHATVLGWTEDTWNRNFPTHDVDIHGYWWKETSDEQKEALQFFGFNENLWDQTCEVEVFDGSVRPCMPYSLFLEDHNIVSLSHLVMFDTPISLLE